MAFGGFGTEVYKFLEELEANNTRDWFAANKSRYETHVREPALDFIEAMAEPLARISKQYVASPRRSGGSLMRVHRDTRFGKDKRPYKTNVGIQFRHILAKDVHAPGFYVHIANDGVFLGVGCWRPDGTALGRIRDAIADNGKAWVRVRDQHKFSALFELVGESLKTAPRGVAKDHPLLVDLRRKDFLGIHNMSQDVPLEASFVDEVAARFDDAKPFVKFLCGALDLQF
jgi:uncharacterized protein (TIGR02453 family)